MLAEGMVAKGDRVVDPFGGIGTGGIVAASLGLQWFGCELEAKFHELGLKNFDLHLMTWQACRDPIPVLVNGDSRKLRENLRGVLAQAVVCSPPYAQNRMDGGDVVMDKPARRAYEYNAGGDGVHAQYGTTPGQLGAMKAGDVAAVVSSPPFSVPGEQPCASQTRAIKDYHAFTRGDGTNLDDVHGGNTPGQLGNMKTGSVEAVVSSPPYAATAVAKNSKGIDRSKQWETYRSQGGGMGYEAFCAQQERHSGDYGSSDGQLSTLPAGEVDAVVTSPPYEGSHVGADDNPYANTNGKSMGEAKSAHLAGSNNYGSGETNLGNTTGETFWHAAKAIVQECHAILRPGGWSAWVVKDFVRNKARVPFCDDWCKLLEACGFTVTTRVHAMLVKETSHPDLFGGDDHVQRTERKSFFRRLAEKKGSPRIDWEEVVFARKASA